MRRGLLLAGWVFSLCALAQPPAGDGTKIELLQPGPNWCDAPPAKNGEVWWVLYATPGEGVRLRYNSISIALDPDENPFRVSVDGFSSNEVILLFRGNKELPRGPVATAFNGYVEFIPGLHLQLGVPGVWRDQSLFLEVLRTVPAGDAETQVPMKGQRYAAFLQCGKKKQCLSEWLACAPWPERDLSDDGPGGLRWAGDLDKDDRMDLLLELQPSDSYQSTLGLFLSSYAQGDELVHLVATRTTAVAD